MRARRTVSERKTDNNAKSHLVQERLVGLRLYDIIVYFAKVGVYFLH